MFKIKGYKFREFEKILKRNNFEIDRYSGDHRIYVRNGSHITIPFKKGCRELPRPMIKRLIKENNIIL